jgi:hypothetical protein
VGDDTSWFVRYHIFANDVQVTEHLNWIGETSLVLRHLTPSTTYTFTIEALDQDDNASTSDAVTLTTEASSDVTPPSVPTNVRIVDGNGCPEFWVGWTRATDDTDPQYLIEYEIYVNGVLSPLAVSAGVDRDFVYATEGGANTFTVKAVDQAANIVVEDSQLAGNISAIGLVAGASWLIVAIAAAVALHKAGAGKAVVVATCLSVVVAAHSAPAAIGFVALFLAGVLRERQRTESAFGAPAVT